MKITYIYKSIQFISNSILSIAKTHPSLFKHKQIRCNLTLIYYCHNHKTQFNHGTKKFGTIWSVYERILILKEPV